MKGAGTCVEIKGKWGQGAAPATVRGNKDPRERRASPWKWKECELNVEQQEVTSTAHQSQQRGRAVAAGAESVC